MSFRLRHGRGPRRGYLCLVAGVMAAATSLALGSATSFAAGGTLTVGSLTAEHLTNPLGIDVAQPRLSWVDTAGSNGAAQSAYEIRVSSRAANDGDVWSSGRVDSSDSYDVVYAGPALHSRTRYYWSVRVWAAGSDQPSQWSSPAWFETAFLDPSEFKGDWIGRAATGSATATPEVLLRKTFTLPNKPVASARAYVVGLGLFKAYVNGSRVGDHELDPAWTAYAKRDVYVTHDITDLVHAGANAIGVSLGHGHFSDYPELKLELDVTFADGTTSQVLSDTSWKTADGPTTANSLSAGESYDARLEQPGWSTAAFDDSAWQPAISRSAPGGVLAAQDMEPIRVTGQLPAPVESPISSSSGSQLYDFRTTRAGWATVAFDGPAGATVHMRYGEKLNSDGTVNNSGQQAYTYILKGGGTESYTPSYSYDGFRYLQIDVPAGVTVQSVVGKRVGTDLESTGQFTSSSDLLNRYDAAMRASILSNVHSVPTDTPMYEKNGWTGDSHLYNDSALLNFGGEAFWENWMRDHRDTQADNGELPVTIPGGAPGIEPVWTYSYIRINWNLWRYRGDVRTLDQNYDGMKRWLQFYADMIEDTTTTLAADAAAGATNVKVASVANIAVNDPLTIDTGAGSETRTVSAVGTAGAGGTGVTLSAPLSAAHAAGTSATTPQYLFRGNTYGDQEAAAGSVDNPQPSPFPSPNDARTVGTAHIFDAAHKLADIARALGKTDDAAADDALADKIRDAYNTYLFNPATHGYVNNNKSQFPADFRQSDNLPPLAFGLVPADKRSEVCAALANDVHTTWKDHPSTGSVTTKLFMPVLSDCGDADLAYTSSVNPTWPGWGWWFQTVNGHNTGAETYIVDSMWEAWCWFRSVQAGGCLNDPARSHDHAFRGTIDDWLYQYLAGIKPTAAGYREIQIKPYPVGDLTSASASVTSPLGQVSSSWTRSGDALTLSVHIPVGATAKVLVPVGIGNSARQQGGARFEGTSGGYATFSAGSGDYTFSTPYSTTSATTTVGGTVPATLALTLGPAASFGPFTPGVAKTYSAATTANVTSTAGDALLTVADPDTARPGHLVNGSYALAQPLQVRATKADTQGTAFNPLGSSLNLLTWTAPVSNDPVALEFQQSIGADEPLRTGTYGKTLTYTLSTTNP